MLGTYCKICTSLDLMSPAAAAQLLVRSLQSRMRSRNVWRCGAGALLHHSTAIAIFLGALLHRVHPTSQPVDSPDESYNRKSKLNGWLIHRIDPLPAVLGVCIL